MKFLRSMAVISAIFSLLNGCATQEHAYYVNEMGELHETNGDITSELKLVAAAMTNAMMTTVQSGNNMRHPSRWLAGVKPMVVILEVDNRTEEFVDSRIVTDSIRAALRTHNALRVLDDELPLPDTRRLVPNDKNIPEWEPLLLYLPLQETSLPLAIPGKDEPSLSQRFKQVPLQPAPVRMSELLPSRQVPPSGGKELAVSADRSEFGPLPSETAMPLPPHETDEPAPVRLSALSTSKNTRPSESNARKRERILSFLETQLKEQNEGKQSYTPIYAIRSVLLPLAVRNFDDSVKPEPYMFKMFIEEIQSQTIKWAGAWEVRKTPSLSSIVENSTGNSYRAPITQEPGRNSGEQGDSTLKDDIRDAAEIIQSISVIRDVIQHY